MTIDAMLAHVWQSTLVAAAIALIAFGFRRVDARTRYWIWFAASLKFMIPFAALTWLGAQFEWRLALPPAPAEWTQAIEAVSQPLLAPHTALLVSPSAQDGGVQPGVVAATIWLLGCAVVLGVWLVRWRRVSRTVRAGATIESGRVFEALYQLAPQTTLPIVSLETSLEPGVFGIFRPVLLWPRDIDTRLDEAQVHAILTHELAHVCRRDNFTAAVHMLVEAIFWFHPLVWWIGARLVGERERACDEEVVRRGSDPHVYAESILRTCQFYVESPLSCMSGVTGSDLKKRIEWIMADRPRTGASAWSRAVLLSGAAITLGAPVVAGAFSAATLPSTIDVNASGRPVFAVATVRPNATGGARVSMLILPDGTWQATNVALESMIRMSYRVQPSQLVGGPDWIYTDRFDIVAKSAIGTLPSDFATRMQSLLAERFKLKLHDETRELPIYSLVTATQDGRPGPRLTPAAVDCTAAAARGRVPSPIAPRKPDERPTCGTLHRMGRVMGSGVSMEQMAQTLAQHTGRMVVDRTGLAGHFDYDLEFEGGSILTTVQEQLGLKLDPGRATVDVLVIDSIERPAETSRGIRP